MFYCIHRFIPILPKGLLIGKGIKPENDKEKQMKKPTYLCREVGWLLLNNIYPVIIFILFA
jgi:hypothetical protein